MLYVSLAALALVGLVSFASAEASAGPADNPVVVFDTTMGPITIELDPAKAPITVENFLKYVDAGFYDGLIFHRVIPDFMVQGGGFDERMNEKTKGIRGPIKNEASNGLSNKRGTISMARTSDPDSASSQFFISVADNSRSLDPRPGSAGYAVFGKVVSGMDAVDAIVKVDRGRRGQHDDVPTKPVVIKSAKRAPKA